MNSRILKIGLSHLKNSIAETLYLSGVCDMTSPMTVHALINEKCNSKCIYCDFWERGAEERVPEMSIDDWKDILLDLRTISSNFTISFSGGEPLIKKGFLDLMLWCSEQGINASFTTNGSLFSEANIRKIVEAEPFNINVSIDSHRNEVHDEVRGFPGNHRIASKGVRMLRDTRDAEGKDFPIVIKPAIHNRNFTELDALVRHALDIGATGINFQPIEGHDAFIKENLWIAERDLPLLAQSVEKLIAMKEQGFPIVNSAQSLLLTEDHFLGKKADKKHLPCRVGLRTLFIRPDGACMLCWHFPDTGNIKTQGAAAVWRSQEARRIRKGTTRCQKLCLLTCTSQKTLMDKVRMAKVMFTGRSKPPSSAD